MNNNGDYFVAAFSTLELAKDYKAKAIAIEGEDGTWGYGIRQFDLDVEVPIDYNMEINRQRINDRLNGK
jgi:hypothetical protein